MSGLKFKRPGDGRCPCIEVPEGQFFIQDSAMGYKLKFHRKGGWLRDTGQTDEIKAQKAASEIITPGESIWWSWNGVGYTAEHEGWRYYLFEHGAGWPRRWFLRKCRDVTEVMAQGTESYLDFVQECEAYVNEQIGEQRWKD